MINFFIKKSSSLPILKVELLVDGRNLYNGLLTNITGSTIFFSMEEENTGVKRILKDVASYEIQGSKVILSYQFSSHNTKKIGAYLGQFNISSNYGLQIFPITEKIKIGIIESIYDQGSVDCCSTDKPIVIIPSPTPSITLKLAGEVGVHGKSWSRVDEPKIACANLPNPTIG